MRESKALLQGLAEVTRERHAKFGMTLYHLEPNLKEAPGGLRDCNVASWLALISAMDKLHDWPDASSLRAPVRKQLDAALDFLMSARCFLHFRHGRDDNTLSWEAQDEAAARKVGATIAGTTIAEEKMPDRGRGFRGAFGGRLDADLFRPCARRAAHRHATAGRNSGSLVRAVPAGAELAVPADDRGFFRGGWAHLSAAAFGAAGSRGAAAVVPFHGAPRAEVERDHRIPHRAGASGAGVDAAPGRGALALPAGNFAAAACRGRAARHAFAAAVDAAAAGTEAHRLAGGARFLSSLHGR